MSLLVNSESVQYRVARLISVNQTLQFTEYGLKTTAYITFVICYEDLALHRVAACGEDRGFVAHAAIALGLALGLAAVAVSALVPRERLVELSQLEALAGPEAVLVVIGQLGVLWCSIDEEYNEERSP